MVNGTDPISERLRRTPLQQLQRKAQIVAQQQASVAASRSNAQRIISQAQKASQIPIQEQVLVTFTDGSTQVISKKDYTSRGFNERLFREQGKLIQSAGDVGLIRQRPEMLQRALDLDAEQKFAFEGQQLTQEQLKKELSRRGLSAEVGASGVTIFETIQPTNQPQPVLPQNVLQTRIQRDIITVDDSQVTGAGQQQFIDQGTIGSVVTPQVSAQPVSKTSIQQISGQTILNTPALVTGQIPQEFTQEQGFDITQQLVTQPKKLESQIQAQTQQAFDAGPVGFQPSGSIISSPDVVKLPTVTQIKMIPSQQFDPNTLGAQVGELKAFDPNIQSAQAVALAEGGIRESIFQPIERTIERLQPERGAPIEVLALPLGVASGVVGLVRPLTTPVETTKTLLSTTGRFITAPVQTVSEISSALSGRISQRGLPFVAGEAIPLLAAQKIPIPFKSGGKIIGVASKALARQQTLKKLLPKNILTLRQSTKIQQVIRVKNNGKIENLIIEIDTNPAQYTGITKGEALQRGTLKGKVFKRKPDGSLEPVGEIDAPFESVLLGTEQTRFGKVGQYRTDFEINLITRNNKGQPIIKKIPIQTKTSVVDPQLTANLDTGQKLSEQFSLSEISEGDVLGLRAVGRSVVRKGVKGEPKVRSKGELEIQEIFTGTKEIAFDQTQLRKLGLKKALPEAKKALEIIDIRKLDKKGQLLPQTRKVLKEVIDPLDAFDISTPAGVVGRRIATEFLVTPQKSAIPSRLLSVGLIATGVSSIEANSTAQQLKQLTKNTQNNLIKNTQLITPVDVTQTNDQNILQSISAVSISEVNLEKQLQKQLSETLSVTRQVPSRRSKTIPLPKIPKVPIKILLQKKPKETVTEKEIKSLASKSLAWQTQVKRRGKFGDVGKPSGIYTALKKGANIVRNDLSATYRVIPKGTLKGSQGKKFVPDSKVFRQFKIKKGQKIATPLQFIEKRKFRLDSPIEKRQIKGSKKRRRVIK